MAAQARVYGKLRSTAEYVGHVGGGSAEVAYIDWLDRAVGYCALEGGAKAQIEGAPHAMLVRSTPEAAVLSAIVPSGDSFGRVFPLMVIAPLHGQALEVGLAFAPVAGEAFFARASVAVREARQSGALPPITSSLANLAVPGRSAMEVARDDFKAWTERPGVAARAWRGLFPAGGAHVALQCLGELARFTAPFRSEREPDRRYVRLPLGGGGAAACSFWLHILARIARERVSVAAWTADGASGTLLVALATAPPVDFWLRLWSLGADSRLLDLVPGVPRSDRSPALPPEVERAALDPAARVVDVLEPLFAHLESEGS